MRLLEQVQVEGNIQLFGRDFRWRERGGALVHARFAQWFDHESPLLREMLMHLGEAFCIPTTILRLFLCQGARGAVN